MTLGVAPRQADLFWATAAHCDGRVAPGSIYGILHRECFVLVPDEMFADLFDDVGRRSVPPMIVAVVMVLQRIEGLSDREAVDRFSFDARWKYAAGGLDFDYPGFAHTVLAGMRARLARSARPDRIFEVTLAAAKAAGLAGRRRVLDSAPVYDAVAAMDTVTLVRSAIRGLLRACDGELAAQLRGVLARDGDYVTAGKPACDYGDPAARGELVDALARDALAALAVLEGRELDPAVAQAAALLATVTGQDLDEGEDGVFRIARRVAADRIISTVDPEARHGRKTSARGFDGYKGHVGIGPDCELVTATTVTAGTAGDASAAAGLLSDELAAGRDAGPPGGEPAAGDARLSVYGDAAYGAGEFLADLEAAGATSMCKVQPPAAAGGRFTKDAFGVGLAARTVTCPVGQIAPLRRAAPGAMAYFGVAGASCPLAARCTTAKAGRTIHSGPCEQQLTAARSRQRDPHWRAGYRATRPKAERKIGHRCDAATADGAPGSAGQRRSPPASPCSPPRSTWPGSRSSASPPATEAGPPPHEQQQR